MTSPAIHDECFYFMNDIQTRMNRIIPNDPLADNLVMPEKVQFEIFSNNEKIYRSLAN
ncbi:MAG TPA: hypothetical protein VFA69_03680 [Candidatus Nitrosotalea sp.]|nr:hypothetical protein [Candidatus Nitrosotalea sp.]